MLRPRSASSTKSKDGAVTLNRFLQSLLVIVILGVIHRYCWIDVPDPFKCGALLNKGQWLDPGRRWASNDPFQNWQPPGCMMHEYKKNDIQACFHKRRLLFIGDSTIRQIFWAVAEKLDHERADEEIADLLDQGEKHKDLEFVANGVTVQFIWDPWLNSTGLQQELSTFQADPSNDIVNGSAGLVLLGAPGLWYARHGQENFHRGFRDAIDAVIPYMDHLSEEEGRTSKSGLFSSQGRAPNLLLLAPIQVPWYPSLSPSREETITPEKIDQMNDFLQQVSQHSSADVVWSYSLMTWNSRNAYEESGLHVISNVAHRKADILLNLRCNADFASYPSNRTCCSNYTRLNIVQWSFLILGMVILPSLSYFRRWQITRLTRLLPPTLVLNAVAVISLVVCYCFYADRTQIFEKEHKQFQKQEFLAGCAFMTAAGILSIRRNPTQSASNKKLSASTDDGFLPRTQTDEWKGWMQAFILVYHYTHGSQTLWIYEIVRLLVASYLFLTGFGHTLYFLRTEDYSLKRVAGVLVRLNLLSCALPYMVRTDYLFYYFAPLVSFWFLVIYSTLRICRHQNSDPLSVMAKILISVTFTTAITMIPGILEFFAFILKHTCAISWDMKEWRFRTFLDMYIIYFGMIVGMLYHRTQKLRSGHLTPERIIDKVLHLTTTYHRLFQTTTIFLSLSLLPGFWILTRRSPNKGDYNWWHPYISFIPILCFVILRNSNRLFRDYHSAVFAWLGRCSLETYVLQYHIWLAGDTTGLLRLGFWNRWVQAAVLTPIFLWASWAAANATQVLTNWIVYSTPNERLGVLGGTLNGHPQLTKDKDIVLDSSEKERDLPNNHMGSFSIDLRWKLGLIGLLMWITNITYM